MELVVDANTLFSALIKDGLTAELLFDESLSLHAPEFFIDEFMKYKDLILTKTTRTEEEMKLTAEKITAVLSKE